MAAGCSVLIVQVSLLLSCTTCCKWVHFGPSKSVAALLRSRQQCDHDMH
jgi:hypothetical protein